MDRFDKMEQTTITVKDKVEFLTKVYDRMAGLRGCQIFCVNEYSHLQSGHPISVEDSKLI